MRGVEANTQPTFFKVIDPNPIGITTRATPKNNNEHLIYKDTVVCMRSPRGLGNPGSKRFDHLNAPLSFRCSSKNTF